ncbi:MAG: hypothetical protein ACI9LG_002481 [Moritella dasanensis]|jgi:hypothetical protein
MHLLHLYVANYFTINNQHETFKIYLLRIMTVKRNKALDITGF